MSGRSCGEAPAGHVRPWSSGARERARTLLCKWCVEAWIAACVGPCREASALWCVGAAGSLGVVVMAVCREGAALWWAASSI